MASTGLTWTATVSSIIRDGNWDFPSGQPEMQEIWNSINFLPQPHKEDTVIWQGNISGKFSISSAWEYIRKKKAQSPLADLIWFSGHVPRYAFTLWLASRERLSTMDRPHVQRIISDNVCVLCRESPETHGHLFFECGYSRELWEVIASKVHLNIPNMNGIPLLMWAATNCTGKKRFDHLLSRHALLIATYFVWQERNRRVFQNQWKTSRTLTGEALHQLRTLLLQHTKPIPEWAMNEWNLQGAELSSSAVPVHLAHPYSGQEASLQPDVQVQLARPSSGQGDSGQHDVPAHSVVQVHPAHPTTGQGDSSQPRGYVQAQIARSMLSWAEMAVSFRSTRAQPISLAE
uniref:Reverse transcriptase zinc-binding domain-containing protein n=1 Tax=Salix viminalis TaxID=40686 RepID=A0A6N2KRN2_SALVM